MLKISYHLIPIYFISFISLYTSVVSLQTTLETHVFVSYSKPMLFNIPFCKMRAFPGGSAGKESTYNARDLGLIPGLGRYPGEGKGYPLQYFGMENSINCLVYGAAKSRTRLSNLHFTSLNFTSARQYTFSWYFSSLISKERNNCFMLTFNEGFPGGPVVKNALAMQETQVQSLSPEDPWSMKWQATSVFLLGKSPGQKSLVGYNPWGRKSQTRLSD